MHNQKNLGILWHINLFFVILFKFWSNQLCLGLEWTNEISHEQEFLTQDLSWMELDYPKDYHPPEEFNLDSGDFTQPTGKKLRKESDDFEKSLGITNHGNVNSKRIIPHRFSAQLEPSIQEGTESKYSQPYTADRFLNNQESIKRSSLESNWDGSHSLAQNRIFNPLIPHIFDSTPHIKKNIPSSANQDDHLSGSLGHMVEINTSFQRLPTQYQDIGRIIQDEGPESIDQNKDFYTNEQLPLSVEKHKDESKKGLPVAVIDNPFSINGSPHQDLQSVDPEIWTMSREETSPQKKTQVQDLNQGKSKKRKGKTNAENSDEDVLKIMDMNVCAPRNQDSQYLFPQKKPSNSPFKVRKSYKSTSIFFLLQKVGICNANRSSTLCYKIYDYFHDIYESMSSRFKSNPKAVQAAAQAVKIAGHGVAMGVLGVIRVFEAEGSKGDHLEIILDDGWRYIENFFRPWRDAELKELALEVDTPFEAHKSLDAYYLLGYLRRLDNTNKVPYLLVHSLALDWSRNRVNSGIPAKTLSAHIQRITDVYQTDSNAIQGGLYGRMSIRNYAFWGEEQLSRRNWYLYEHTQRSSHDVLSLSSNAAQFHTPVGREMCQVVHNFFEDLINDLKRFYMIMNGHSTVKDPPGEALRDIGMIIQAVSMAEYRVTVVFLGVIRILNQKHLDNSQLERLIINAWVFLKSRFSEWRFLDLYTKNSQQLFGFDSVRVTSSTQFDSAGDLFKALAGFKDKNGCPKNWVVHLLKSWRNSITERDNSSLGDLGFPIAEIPSGPIDNWNLSPFGH